MNRPRVGCRVMAALLVLPVGAGCDAEPDMPELGDEVRTFLQSYVATVAAGDTAALRTFYTDDRARFVWYEDGEARYRTPQQILDAVGAMSPETAARTELGDGKVLPLARSAAWAATDFETTFGAGASAVRIEGVMTVTLEREDGAWKILTGHTSTRRARPDADIAAE